MKVLVLNAQHASGVSKKTGSQYDISTLTYCVPVQQVSREDRTVLGYGFQAQEIGLDPAALPQFANLTFPAEITLRIEADPRNLNRNICKGIVSK